MSKAFSIGSQSGNQIAKDNEQAIVERELLIDSILDSAKGKFKELLIIGRDNEGNILTLTDGAMLQKDLLWLIKVLETKILKSIVL